MESVFPNPFAFRNFGINGVHPSSLLQSHMKTRIEKRNILNSLQLIQTRPHDQ